jgi:hypothetical protein
MGTNMGTLVVPGHLDAGHRQVSCLADFDCAMKSRD